MSQVIIRRCSVCPSIRSHAQAVAAALKTELGIEPQMIDGAKGEFTVLVDGEPIRRGHPIAVAFAIVPPAREVVAAVRDRLAGR